MLPPFLLLLCWCISSLNHIYGRSGLASWLCLSFLCLVYVSRPLLLVLNICILFSGVGVLFSYVCLLFSVSHLSFAVSCLSFSVPCLSFSVPCLSFSVPCLSFSVPCLSFSVLSGVVARVLTMCALNVVFSGPRSKRLYAKKI
jgi:hypothetical protein